MLGQLPPPELRPGDELTVKYLNALRKFAVEGTIAHLGAGLAGMPSPNGWSIGLAFNGIGSFLCVTNGTISACGAFSGATATAGSGSVFLCTVSGTTITKKSDTLSVLNFSTTTGGIASGVNVWVSIDPDGNYFITSVDCGN